MVTDGEGESARRDGVLFARRGLPAGGLHTAPMSEATKRLAPTPDQRPSQDPHVRARARPSPHRDPPPFSLARACARVPQPASPKNVVSVLKCTQQLAPPHPPRCRRRGRGTRRPRLTGRRSRARLTGGTPSRSSCASLVPPPRPPSRRAPGECGLVWRARARAARALHHGCSRPLRPPPSFARL